MIRKKWSSSEFDTAKKLLEKGLSYDDIGKILGRTKKSVKLYLNKHGLKRTTYFTSTKIKIFCTNCKKEIFRTPSQINTENNFCSVECAYNFNKDTLIKSITKHGQFKTIKTCPVCDTVFTTKGNAKYCSKDCMLLNFKHITNLRIEQGLIKTPQTIKNYLYEKVGKFCSICGLKDWLNKEIVLILDHIDGNSENCSLDNLRLLCPNCDSQTDTFKGKNKGNGRHRRRERYKKGLSY